MKTLHKTLSFAQMLVRSQWRHEARTAAAPVAGAERRDAASPDRRPAPTVERRRTLSIAI